MRILGIPTVLDRLIQQALHQVLHAAVRPDFSDSLIGFRPGRSAHQAMKAARAHVAGGHRWVVDLDLEKFFDRVNHDVLMARLARKIEDKRVLRLIRRYLQAGIDGGRAGRRSGTEGTPQGGPLSPLLSNILLDELDKELERRGHGFCRYADDCNIYVRSKARASGCMASIEPVPAERLSSRSTRQRARWTGPGSASSWAITMTFHKEPRLRVAPTSVGRFKGKLKAALRRARGRNIACTVKRPHSTHARLDRILPAGRGEGHIRGTGRVDTAQDCAASCGGNGSGRCTRKRAADATRTVGGTGMAVGQQRPRPLVECRGQPHERTPSVQPYFDQSRAAITAHGAPTL